MRPPLDCWRQNVDGQDVRAVHAVAKQLVERARRGDGPAFLLCNTYRYTGHHVGDINREYYRSKQEEQNVEDASAIRSRTWSAWLIEQKLADQAQLEQVDVGGDAEMEKAVEFAIGGPISQVQTKWSRTSMPETASARTDFRASRPGSAG